MEIGATQGRAAPRELAAGALQAALYLAYPLVVYLGYARLGARGLGAVLLGLYGLSVALRLRGSAADIWRALRPHLALACLIGLAIALGDARLLLFLPMLASLAVLATFAWSLHRGPPMIERFARAIEHDLPPFTLGYCRKVTLVWCAFLALNALAVGALALFAPLAWWTLYTGLIFYLLLGALLAGETLVRKLWFRGYGRGIVDRLLARAFPPERTANGRRSLAYRGRWPRH
jgi:uncharacterized membrane protein